MARIRVYKLAEEVGVPSRDMVKFLTELGADVKNHMSTIDDEIAAMVREHFSEEDEAEEVVEKSAARETKKSKTKRSQVSRRRGRGSDDELVEDERSQDGRASKKGRRRTRQSAQEDKSAGNNQDAARSADRPAEKVVEIPESITVQEFADRVGIRATELIKRLMSAGIMASINQSIDQEAASLVAKQLGFQVVEPEKQEDDLPYDVEVDPDSIKTRPPVVTILGHVDHGKTTLLDTIRKSRIVESEHGGITQHIGAYRVPVGDRTITFLDTPGHEAFTQIRSRGAQATDIAVLVVAADDGVMPQTVEAINHAKAADVPIVVAINKIDLPGANPDRVKQQLAEYGLLAEDWGGDTVMVPISALKGEGIDELLEMILLVADMQELKARTKGPATGVVIESELDKGRGPVATVLIKEGVLRVGDACVAGAVHGKVRAMVDDQGNRLEEAGPSMPVEVLGMADVPQAGDRFTVVESEREARTIASARQEAAGQARGHSAGRLTLGELMSRVQQGEVKELSLIVKADVQGSLEALRSSLERLSTDKVYVNIIHGGVGAVSETDVNLAIASDAIIIGFNVRPDTTARKAAEREGVEIRLYRVIYEVIDDIEKAMEGMLEPEYEEVVLGRAEVRATFRVPGVGTVAGCYVTDGRVVRNAQVRIMRDGVVIQEDKVDSLKRFQDDVREVSEGYECGIGLERFNDIKEGDVLEIFEMREVER